MTRSNRQTFVVRSPARVFRTLCMAFGACALGTACSTSLPRPAIVLMPVTTPIVVAEEPPPALVEEVPARPAVEGAVWIDGEWTWARRRYVWNKGRWVVPPAGATYSPWVSVRGPDGTIYFAPAGWRDAAGAPMPPPMALAEATVGPVVVVTRADGETARITVAVPKK